MNKITILGRFVENPTIAYTKSNKAILKSTIAVNRNFKNTDGQYDADFIRIIAFDKKAETIAQYFDKGSRILISGRLQTGSYDDKDNKKKYTTDVIVEEIDFIETRKENSQFSPSHFENKSNSQIVNDVMKDDDPFASFGDSIQIDDDRLD